MTAREVAQVVSLWDSGATIKFIASIMPYKEHITKAEIARLRAEGVLKPRKAGEIRCKAVADRYREGDVTVDELSAEFGLARGYVLNILHFANVPLKDRERRREAILERLKSGASLSQTAREFGVSRQAVFELKQKYLGGQKDEQM